MSRVRIVSDVYDFVKTILTGYEIRPISPTCKFRQSIRHDRFQAVLTKVERLGRHSILSLIFPDENCVHKAVSMELNIFSIVEKKIFIIPNKSLTLVY